MAKEEEILEEAKDGANQINNGSSAAGPSAPAPKASRPPPAPPAGLPNGTVANIHNEFGQPNDCVLLDGLNWWTTDEDIVAAAAQANVPIDIRDVTFAEHKINGKSRGQAFVECHDQDGARRLREWFNGREFQGKQITTVLGSSITGNPYKLIPKEPNSKYGKPDGPPGAPRGPASGGFADRGGRGGGRGGFVPRGRGGYAGGRGGHMGGGYSSGPPGGYQNGPSGGMSNNMGGNASNMGRMGNMGGMNMPGMMPMMNPMMMNPAMMAQMMSAMQGGMGGAAGAGTGAGAGAAGQGNTDEFGRALKRSRQE
ncbi:hypothetical protein NliqN6_4144 [Naganishia liquefaciens]|uniref:RRM domain-containing protein n=1 Tax=Naganishia liquefaciens TaxID=104408 RepID=A0A8H3TV58_9TREE|nr:hypothetical protein NliqN6_4144 [Naganishia liquefaciens]